MAVIIHVLLAGLLGLCWKTPCVEGVEFNLDGGTTFFITTDDPININDISINPSGVGLICQSENEIPGNPMGRHWYIDPEMESTAMDDRIVNDDVRGWVRTTVGLSNNIRQVIIRREETGAVEGVFTCEMELDINPTRSLYVLYPISVTASIIVVSATDVTFNVQCTSTGGIALSMSVTGPDGYSSDLTDNIQPMGTPEYIGDDSYTATTSDITEGNDGDMYECTVTGLTSETDSVVLRVPPQNPPMNVMADNVGTTSVSVSWDAVNDADRYTVTFRRATQEEQQGACDGAQHTASVTVNATSTTASINIGGNVESSVTDMLRAYSTYFITMVASNGGGNSDDSDEISILTSQIGAAIPPANVMVTDVNSFSITVQWNAPSNPCRAINGLITSYSIRYTIQPNGIPQTPLQRDGLEITLTELTPFTEYSIEVAAVSENGDVGVYSEPEVVMTPEAPPGPVSDITSFPSFFTITITWEQPAMPNGIITDYEVFYGPTDSMEPLNSTRTSLKTNFTTPYHIEPGTEFNLTVRAYTNAPEPGEPKSIIVSTLNRPSTVEEVMVASLNDTSVNVSWTEVVIPGHDINNYTVIYSPVTSKRQEEGEMMIIVPGSVTSIVITGLDPSFNYQFQVFATVIIDGQTLEGDRSNTTNTMRDLPTGGGGGGGSGDSAGGIVAGVIVALIVVAVIVTAIVLVVLWRRHHNKDKGSSYKPSTRTTDYTAPPVHYSKSNDIESNGDNAIEPKITKFPEDKHVLEGEKVVFKVRVTGSPQPKMTWYHDGQEIKSDYSMELGDDGSLTMPSTETKHSGVYQLVARNKVGSVEREVKLFVKKEGAPSPYVARKHITFSPIPLDQFGEYVAQCHANDNREFRDHYTELDKDTDHPITIGTDPNLKLLNRFANITVYDDNRIILRPIEGHPDCQREFINACYVDGYKIRNKFIATQGPLPKTVVDLWRLVWQEKPLTIVMVTNLKEGTKIKCQQYWPETGTKNFGPFQVTISDEQKLADFTTRTLLVELKGSSERALKVTQFHFTAWPDHGVPDYATPILAFHKKIKKQHRPSKGPMLIHCSAGVGRTGTLITIDRVLDQIEKEKVVDIAGVIQHLRHQRMKMVQNVEQYIFINDAILESVTCGDTQITASDLRRAIQILSRQDPQTRLTGFENQFKVLDQVSPKPDEIQREKALENPTKNRNEDFLPGDRWRVVLKGEVEDYIHAVVVNGYKQQRAFIIAQSPMKSTARDFWKMIYDRKCGVIVMLCDLVENEKDVCHQYWPDSGKMQVGGFTVELLGEEKLEGFIICTFSVFHKKSNKVQQVYQIRMTNWSPDGHCSNLTGITDTIAEVTKIQQRTGNHPILVHCSDTVSRSGMFCAITTTIERCKTEQVVDVFQVVKALRVQKPGAVQTVAQFHTLFETVLVYLDSFDTYGNFRDL